MKIVAEARQQPPSSKPVKGFGWEVEEDEEEDIDAEVEEEDDEDEYDKRVKEVHASGEYQISWAVWPMFNYYINSLVIWTLVVLYSCVS